MSEGSAIFRLMRRKPYSLPLSIIVNLLLLGAGFAVVIIGEHIDGVVQVGMSLTVWFGFVVGAALVAIFNVIVQLTGPAE